MELILKSHIKGYVKPSSGVFVAPHEDSRTKKPEHLLAPNGKPSKLNPIQYAQVRSPEFKEWFGDWESDPENASKVLDNNGEPLVVYHGTVTDFTEFDSSKTNIEADMGAGFYFTNARSDLSNNYSKTGPDMKSKINMLAERLQQEAEADDKEISYEKAKKMAKKQLIEHKGATMPVYLKMLKPVIVGGKNETFFDFEWEYDEDTEEYGEEKGLIVDLMEAIRNIDESEFNVDKDHALAVLSDEACDRGGLKAEDLVNVLKNAFTGAEYMEDGGYAGNEIPRRLLMEMGFDGYIDNTVNSKFGTKRDLGKPMRGMGVRTVHYIVNEPNQIKSAVGNSGKFSSNNDNITKSMRLVLIRQNSEPTFSELLKSHVKAYTKKDGTFVAAHETKVIKNMDTSHSVFEDAKSYVLENGKKRQSEKIEFGVVYSNTGEILVQRIGEVCSISFDDRELRIIKHAKGATLVHNHPSNYSLSGDDLNFARLQGCSIYAIGHKGTDYYARILIPSIDIKKPIAVANNMVREEFWRLVNEERVTPEQASDLHSHAVNTLLADAGYIEYKVTNMVEIPDLISEAINDLIKHQKRNCYDVYTN